MNYFRKVDELRVDRGWSFYRLSQETGLSQQTFTQWMNGKTVPTLTALQLVCKAFDITLAEFLAENDVIVATPENKALLDNWQLLTKTQKQSILEIIKNYLNK